MWTRNFWIATVERAVKTAGQSLVLFWAVGDGLLNVWSIDAKQTTGIVLGGFLLSVVTSLASIPFTNTQSPSLTDSK